MGSEWVEIFKAVVSLLTVMFTGVMAYMTVKLNIKAAAAAVAVGEVKQKAEEAATIVQEVKEKLAVTTGIVDKKLDDIGVVGKDVHTLVNSNMGIQLQINMVSLRRLALANPRNKEDQLAAKLAKKLFDEHQKRQAIVDASKEKINANT